MRYLLLVYSNRAATPPERLEELLRGHTELHRELAGAGRVISSASLADPPAATTVRVREGVPTATDGPFVEAKEYLAGYYLVDCDSVDQAIEIATRIPCGLTGGVEIRPVDEAATDAVRGEL